MNQSKRNEIIGRWQAGASIRQIARELGLARNTVSGVLGQVQAQRAGVPPGSPTPRRPSRLDPNEPIIHDLVGRYPDLTAVRLLEELRQRGFAGSYTVVRQRLARLRVHATPQRGVVEEAVVLDGLLCGSGGHARKAFGYPCSPHLYIH